MMAFCCRRVRALYASALPESVFLGSPLHFCCFRRLSAAPKDVGHATSTPAAPEFPSTPFLSPAYQGFEAHTLTPSHHPPCSEKKSYRGPASGVGPATRAPERQSHFFFRGERGPSGLGWRARARHAPKAHKSLPIIHSVGNKTGERLSGDVALEPDFFSSFPSFFLLSFLPSPTR